MSRWIGGVLLLALACAPAALGHAPDPKPETLAQSAAESWLALVDAGSYGESWDSAAELFKKSVTRPQWVDWLTKARTPLGRLASRKLQGARYQTDLPGAPTGEYVTIAYDATFADGGAAVETITPMKDPDGAWRVSGYFIRPAK